MSRVIAIVPARAGSKGIPGKNLVRVGGYSLVARAIRSANEAELIDQVFVSTDGEDIATEARNNNGGVVARPAELANDTASSESAIIHAIESLATAGTTPEVVVFIQPTSPFIDSGALDRAIARVLAGTEDCVFSAFATYGFLWEASTDGATGVNHDKLQRPRRQDREPHYMETGAFYVFKTQGFLEAKHRFFGRVGIEEVSEKFAVEIDDLDQLETARLLAPEFDSSFIPKGAIQALVMDFDGVHTNDSATVNSEGLETVEVSRSDGMGISMMKKAGLPMLILSKETNAVVKARAKKLGIEAISGIDNKLPELLAWSKNNNVALEQVAYIGNDLNDLECMNAVGWAIAPSNAHPEIKKIARVCLAAAGGQGAIRELVELILTQPKAK